MSNILFVDDDKDFLEINYRYFTKEGYQVNTLSCSVNTMKLLNQFQPDCIILDVMMPGINGFELCKRIRSVTAAPIIFLSGRTSENDKIKALLLGGDDYLIKPFSFRELSARIKAQIRRYHSQNSFNQMIRYPPLSLDLKQHKAFHDKDDLQLSNREYDLLLLLVTRSNQIVTFEEISNHIWGTYSENDSKTIMVIASRLRKKLSPYEDLTNAIETVWSKGYTFHIKQEYLK
jgi:two-component system, OmpR family, lantibiotic biosynthesis response regulator NisR/SpaR